VEIAMERIRLAEMGKLKIRPMSRPVYDPKSPMKNVPPQSVNIDSEPIQRRLLEKGDSFGHTEKRT